MEAIKNHVCLQRLNFSKKSGRKAIKHRLNAHGPACHLPQFVTRKVQQTLQIRGDILISQHVSTVAFIETCLGITHAINFCTDPMQGLQCPHFTAYFSMQHHRKNPKGPTSTACFICTGVCVCGPEIFAQLIPRIVSKKAQQTVKI